jgi:cytochrome c553
MSILTVFKILSYSLSILLFFAEGEVLFESEESKTAQQGAVFNKVSLVSKSNQDIWTMKQSHGGLEAKDWDHVKIIIDKTKRPYRVSYHQLDKDGRETEYRASCFRCHSGGPRYIRPKENSISKISLIQKLKIQQWNLLIKSYGDVEIKANDPFKRQIALKSHREGSHLKVKACTHCHYQGGPRAELTKEHALTIKFLVDQGEMPPWPYQISEKEKKEIKKFVYGF